MDTQDDFLYRRYTVDIEFTGGLAGGTPLKGYRGIIAQHVKLFGQGVSNPLKYAKEVEGEVTEDAIAEYLERCSSGFPADEAGIYLRGIQFNAMLKDAAQRMKATIARRGLGNTIRDGGLLFPNKVYLDAAPMIIERPVKPDNGPSNIKIFQVVENIKLSVPCAVLENGDLPDKLFRQMWIVAQGIGLGANRHLDYGRFNIVDIRQEDNWDITDLWANGRTSAETMPVPEAVGGDD